MGAQNVRKVTTMSPARAFAIPYTIFSFLLGWVVALPIALVFLNCHGKRTKLVWAEDWRVLVRRWWLP